MLLDESLGCRYQGRTRFSRSICGQARAQVFDKRPHRFLFRLKSA